MCPTELKFEMNDKQIDFLFVTVKTNTLEFEMKNNFK